MFGGGRFRESTAEKIGFPTINAATFEQVLKFAYTGDAVVSSSNVCGLLEASELFKLPGIEDLCVEFAQQNKLTVQNALGMFSFACSTDKKTLMDLLSRYIADHFDVVSIVDRFLDISYNALVLILNQSSSSAAAVVRNEESLLGAITRWVHHNRVERLQYVSKLFDMIRFENISPAYVRFMFEKFVIDSNISALTHISTPVGDSEVSELPAPKTSFSKAESLLHIFVTHEKEKLMRIFSINETRHDCVISAEVSHEDREQKVRNVLNDVYLYSLNYSRIGRHPSRAIQEEFQTFCAYTSVSMNTKISLKKPPLIVEDVDMCALRTNFLYMYNKFNLEEEAIRTNSSTSVTLFDNEEINRGMYVYNCEVNNWFPVPTMKKQLDESCLAACNETLFLIGGQASDGTIPAGYAQAFDYRIGKWQELPKTNYNYCGAACCAIQGNIYVCGGWCYEFTPAEKYDSVAGKWEKLACRPMGKGQVYDHRAVNYLNQLWVMLTTKDFSVEIYEPKMNKWSSSLALKKAVKKTASPVYIVDAVVSKPK
jgi:hypothetical protein